jgi:hypothetical protein
MALLNWKRQITMKKLIVIITAITLIAGALFILKSRDMISENTPKFNWVKDFSLLPGLRVAIDNLDVHIKHNQHLDSTDYDFLKEYNSSLNKRYPNLRETLDTLNSSIYTKEELDDIDGRYKHSLNKYIAHYPNDIEGYLNNYLFSKNSYLIGLEEMQYTKKEEQGKLALFILLDGSLDRSNTKDPELVSLSKVSFKKDKFEDESYRREILDYALNNIVFDERDYLITTEDVRANIKRIEYYLSFVETEGAEETPASDDQNKKALNTLDKLGGFSNKPSYLDNISPSTVNAFYYSINKDKTPYTDFNFNIQGTKDIIAIHASKMPDFWVEKPTSTDSTDSKFASYIVGLFGAEFSVSGNYLPEGSIETELEKDTSFRPKRIFNSIKQYIIGERMSSFIVGSSWLDGLKKEVPTATYQATINGAHVRIKTYYYQHNTDVVQFSCSVTGSTKKEMELGYKIYINNCEELINDIKIEIITENGALNNE